MFGGAESFRITEEKYMVGLHCLSESMKRKHLLCRHTPCGGEYYFIGTREEYKDFLERFKFD